MPDLLIKRLLNIYDVTENHIKRNREAAAKHFHRHIIVKHRELRHKPILKNEKRTALNKSGYGNYLACGIIPVLELSNL